MITNKHINKIVIICTVIILLLTGVMIYVGNTDLVTSSSGVSFDYETKLFDHDTIMTVDIQVDEDSWNEMLDNASAEEYISCTVVINGEAFANVGIRPKGNTSLTQIVADDTTDRYSFKIEFDHYDKNLNCYGLDKLVLNNVMSDSTYMKEYLSYDILNYAGVVTPLYNYASITLNGEDWGFYIALEAMEESFAMRNYGSSYGQLYKPETMGVGGDEAGGMDIDMSDFKANFEERMNEMNVSGQTSTGQADNSTEQGDVLSGQNVAKTEQGDASSTQNATTQDASTSQNNSTEQTTMPDFSDMKQGFEGGGMGGGFGSSSSSATLEYIDDEIDSYSTIFDASVFDTDESDYERVITAIKNLNEGTDLETYVDVDAVLRYIAANTVIVNLDSYFSSMQHNYYLYEEDGQITMLPWDYNLSFAGFQSGTATSAINFPIDTPVSGIELEDRPIIAKLFENEEYLAQYHQILQEIVTGYFDSGLYLSTINTIDAQISSYVKSDVSAFYTYDEYETGVENLIQFGLLRAKSIQGQLNGTIPSTTAGQEADSTTLIDGSSVNLTAMGTQGGGNGGGGGGNMQGFDPSTMMQGEMPQMPGTTSESTDANTSSDASTTTMTPPQMPSDTTESTDTSTDATTMTPPQMPSDTSESTSNDTSTDTTTMTPPQRNGDTNGGQFGNRGGRGGMPGGFSGDMSTTAADNTESQTTGIIVIAVCMLLSVIAVIVVVVFKRRKYRA
ncbi:CotH kinase family protein [Anaerosporobacter sp.]|uniref:CotH kinase family protein n=1 Tax=Anaerosporobacter sp. TaxID=1872529 RepID=UPI00286EDD1C|nr:CotH kinase family protein [Anaerosporobacter sp.]